MSNRSKFKMKSRMTTSNETGLIKLIRIMPIVLSAVCAAAALAKFIG